MLHGDGAIFFRDAGAELEGNAMRRFRDLIKVKGFLEEKTGRT
jgi:hypothetical protein